MSLEKSREQDNISLEAQKKQLLQETINNHLLKWVDINNEGEYIKFINILNKSLGIDLSKTWYKSINNGSPFAFKKNTILDNTITVFSLYSFLSTNHNWPFSKLWNIDRNWTFTKDLSRTINYNTDRNVAIDSILNDLDNKINNLKPIREEAKDKEPIKEQIDITIKKGDRLWNLIKSNYKVTKNAQIVEILNHICTLNNLKDSWNLIEISQKIVFPKKIGINWNEYLIK